MKKIALGILLLIILSSGLFSMLFVYRIQSPERQIKIIDNLIFIVGDIPPFNILLEGIASASNTPLIEPKYDIEKGKGFVLQKMPDGKRFLINFSLFSGDGIEPKGLFIGGSPESLPLEASGISYFDGTRWRHLWCTANEGISASGGEVIQVPNWKYISGDLERTFSHIRLSSKHEVIISGQPILIERTAYVQAGESLLTLSISIKNTGMKPIVFDYAYGDEPWVGEYGNSLGDIGWYEGGVVKYEMHLPKNTTYAGFINKGNDAIGEGQYDGTLNFISWQPEAVEVYFSNDFHKVEPSVPLKDRENRILNIVWKAQSLMPTETKTYRFQIGGGDSITSLKGDSITFLKR